MMRRMFSFGLAAVLGLCVAGTAGAATTIDLLFPNNSNQNFTSLATNFVGNVTMDVFLTTDDPLEIFSITVSWDNSGTSAAAGTLEWDGIMFTIPSVGDFTLFAPGNPGFGGTFIDNNVLKVYSFDGQQFGSTGIAAGTYKIGTIVWSTTQFNLGTAIESIFISGLDGILEPKNVVPSTINLNSATINVIPEPGTASLLGLGLVGLILAGRRKRA